MPPDVDGVSDEIDELVDWQLLESPAARRNNGHPTLTWLGLALPDTTRETVEES